MTTLSHVCRLHVGLTGTAILTSRRARSGLTLVEVVFALAIFLFSVAAIYQLMSFSSANILEGSVRSRGPMLCQSKMAEVMAGAVSLGPTGYASFGDSNPGFEWRVSCEPEDEIPGLWHVEVFVKKNVPGRGDIEVSLSQYVYDASKRGSTLDPPIPSTANNSGG